MKQIFEIEPKKGEKLNKKKKSRKEKVLRM